MPTDVPRIGANRPVQVPNGFIALAKVLENRVEGGILMTLVRWIDIRREPEWVPASIIPPERNHDGR